MIVIKQMNKKKGIVIGIVAVCLVALLAFKLQRFLPTSAQDKTIVQTVDWSNTHIDKVEVFKAKREVQVLQNGQVVKTYKMRLGFDPVGHKTTEGDGKTPEGVYTLDWRNPNSQFYKSLHISYPNAQDVAQAEARGVSAGGDVMIHGSMKKTGGAEGQPLYDYLPQQNWTLGCIAVSNRDMDELWQNVKDGTTIEIFP